MKLLVKEFLMNKSFNDLEQEHGVCARPNSTFDKYSLNYDMILATNGDPVSEQCRGLVIRPVEHLRIATDPVGWKDSIVGEIEQIAWPMCRFYNHGDSNASQINWTSPRTRVFEKLDGTMIVMYWDKLHERWHAATRSVPEADLPIRLNDLNLGDMTFSKLFWNALMLTHSELSGSNTNDFDRWLNDVFDKEHTYVFELTTPVNRVVVKYINSNATLLAIKHTSSGIEKSIDSIIDKNVKSPKTWELNSASAIEAFVNSADPATLEGAVVLDDQFRRLKIKNKAWVLSSKAKDLITVSKRSALESTIMGTIDDVIPLVEKDIADQLNAMRVAVAKYFSVIDANFKTFKEYSYGSRKTFAEQVFLSDTWSPPYFNMWEGKATCSLEWTRSAIENGKMTSGSLDIILKHLKM